MDPVPPPALGPSFSIMPPAPPLSGARPSGRPSTARTLKIHKSPPRSPPIPAPITENLMPPAPPQEPLGPPPPSHYTRRRNPSPGKVIMPPEAPPMKVFAPPEPPKEENPQSFRRRGIVAASKGPQELKTPLTNDEHDTLIYDETCKCYKGKFIDGKQIVIKIKSVADEYNAMDYELQSIFRNIYQISQHASYSYYYDKQLLNTVQKFKEHGFDIDKYADEYIENIKNKIHAEPEDVVFNPAFLYNMSGDSTKEKIDSIVKRIIEAQSYNPQTEPKHTLNDTKTLGEELKNANQFDNTVAELNKDTVVNNQDSEEYIGRREPIVKFFKENKNQADRYNNMNVKSQTLYREIYNYLEKYYIDQRTKDSLERVSPLLDKQVLNTVEILEKIDYDIRWYSYYYYYHYNENTDAYNKYDIMYIDPKYIVYSEDALGSESKLFAKIRFYWLNRDELPLQDPMKDVKPFVPDPFIKKPDSYKLKTERKFIPVKDSEEGEYKITPDVINIDKFGLYYRGERINNQDPIAIFSYQNAKRYNTMDVVSQMLFRTIYNQILKQGSSEFIADLEEKVFNTIDILKTLNNDIEWYAYYYYDNQQTNSNIFTPHDLVAFSNDRGKSELQKIIQIQKHIIKPSTPDPLKTKLPAIKGATKGGRRTKKRGQKKRRTQKKTY